MAFLGWTGSVQHARETSGMRKENTHAGQRKFGIRKSVLVALAALLCVAGPVGQTAYADGGDIPKPGVGG